MENNIVEDKTILITSHYCESCSMWMEFNTTEEISNGMDSFLCLVYMCRQCENKIYILDTQKEYYKDIFDHLKKKNLIA